MRSAFRAVYVLLWFFQAGQVQYCSGVPIAKTLYSEVLDSDLTRMYGPSVTRKLLSILPPSKELAFILTAIAGVVKWFYTGCIESISAG